MKTSIDMCRDHVQLSVGRSLSVKWVSLHFSYHDEGSLTLTMDTTLAVELFKQLATILGTLALGGIEADVQDEKP